MKCEEIDVVRDPPFAALVGLLLFEIDGPLIETIRDILETEILKITVIKIRMTGQTATEATVVTGVTVVTGENETAEIEQIEIAEIETVVKETAEIELIETAQIELIENAEIEIETETANRERTETAWKRTELIETELTGTYEIVPLKLIRITTILKTILRNPETSKNQI